MLLMKYTVHAVLAGAYRGRDISSRELLYHASTDEGSTAVCKTVKADSLCDTYENEEKLSCETCMTRVVKRGLLWAGLTALLLAIAPATHASCYPSPNPPPTPPGCRYMAAECVCDTHLQCHWVWICAT